MGQSKISMALFFTRGLSIQNWAASGLITREVLLYELHLRNRYFENIYWVTYGEQESEERCLRSLDISIEGKAIKVLGRPKFLRALPNFLYWPLIPFIHFHFLSRCQVFKSNQMDGAWAAWWASLFLHKKFYLRTGYTWSRFLRPTFKRRVFRFIENALYKQSSAFAVSSLGDLNYVKDYAPQGKGMVLGNFIDIEVFAPKLPVAEHVSFVTVARFSPEKNLSSLIRAFKGLSHPLTIIGDGALKGELEELIAAEKISNVRLHPRVSNRELPEILPQHSHFILPSIYEGNPKALLEAMALGMICIGTNVPGISEILNDGENGILSYGTDASQIRRAVLRSVQANIEMRTAAAAYVRNAHDINVIAMRERDLLINL